MKILTGSTCLRFCDCETEMFVFPLIRQLLIIKSRVSNLESTDRKNCPDFKSNWLFYPFNAICQEIWLIFREIIRENFRQPYQQNYKCSKNPPLQSEKSTSLKVVMQNFLIFGPMKCAEIRSKFSYSQNYLDKLPVM